MAIDCATFIKNLLAVISKTITLQIKDKLAHKMTSASLLASLGSGVIHIKYFRRMVQTFQLLGEQIGQSRRRLSNWLLELCRVLPTGLFLNTGPTLLG